VTQRGLRWAIIGYLLILATLCGSFYALYQITH
jgi:hypothetical protein